MRLTRRQIARAHELIPRAAVLQKRHGVQLASTVNKNIGLNDTAIIEAVLHELAHFIVMEERPGRGTTDRIDKLMASLTTYVTDELEIDTAYTVMEAGIELGLWSWSGAFKTIVDSTTGSLRLYTAQSTARARRRVTQGFQLRARLRIPASADRIRWLVDWFLHDEAREAWKRVREEPAVKAANAP